MRFILYAIIGVLIVGCSKFVVDIQEDEYKNLDRCKKIAKCAQANYEIIEKNNEKVCRVTQKSLYENFFASNFTISLSVCRWYYRSPNESK